MIIVERSLDTVHHGVPSFRFFRKKNCENSFWGLCTNLDLREVRRPRILMFDEATSALDNLTQAIVTESITRVVIAHRLTTVIDADRIYLVKKGQIVQSGEYHQLLAEPGPPAIDLNQRRRARSGCRRLAQRRPQELQALAAEMLVLPRIARAAKLRAPPLGHRRAVRPLPPLVALAMSRLGFHGSIPIPLTIRHFGTRSEL
jgi:hypothetical protein